MNSSSGYSQQFNRYRHELSQGVVTSPSILHLVLPPGIIGWIFFFLLVYPLVTAAANSLLVPLYDYFVSLFLPFSSHIASASDFPWLVLLKLTFFIPLAFLALGLLLLKIIVAYHAIWAAAIPQAHALHPAFVPDQKQSMVSLLNWVFYRAGRILLRPVGFLIVLAVLSGFMILFFQYFSPGLVFLLQFLAVFLIFILLCVGFYTMVAFVIMVSRFFQTSLGTTASVLEPDQPAERIYERVKRIQFLSPWSFIILGQEILFYALVLFSVNYNASELDISLILDPGFPILKLLLINAMVLAFMLVLYASKFFLYIDNLSRFYIKKTHGEWG